MKNIISLFCLSLSLVLFSCTSKSDMLVGEWKVIKYDIPRLSELIDQQASKAPDSLRASYKEMLVQNSEKMKTEVLHSTFEFKKDGGFNIITTEFTQKGTWSLSKDGKMLFSKDSASTNMDTFYISTLEPKKLEFKISNSEKIESFFGLEKTK